MPPKPLPTDIRSGPGRRGRDMKKDVNDLLDRAREALIWTTGSGDFAPGGKARKGFKKTVKPMIDEIGDYLKEE